MSGAFFNKRSLMARKQARYGQPAVYNSTLPTYSDGDDAGLQVDERGRLITNASVTVDNLDVNVDGLSYGGVEATTMQNSAVAVGNGTSMDVSGMETLLLAVSGITTATIVVEGELPSGTWNTLNVKNASGGALSTSITANGVYVAAVAGYLNVRARISVWTAGTVVVTGTATAAGNHAEMQNVAMTQRLDSVNDSITAYPFGHNASYISTATTTTVKTGAGVLHSIAITETAAGAITIYDNTAGSGTTIAVFKASIAEGSYMLNIAFTTGLTIVTAGASKLTVSYR